MQQLDGNKIYFEIKMVKTGFYISITINFMFLIQKLKVKLQTR